MPLPSGPTAQRIGFLLTRVIVPLWVLSGAFMKLYAASPKLLPKNIWTKALEAGVELYFLLFVLVALEFFAVAVMFFLPRFARFMSIWMLSIFCLILIAEIAAGNTKCGCLGSFSPPPQVMLAIDGLLLLGVLLFRPPKYAVAWVPKTNFIVATIFTVVFGAITAFVILGERAPAAAAPAPAPPVEPGTPADGGEPAEAQPEPAVAGLQLPPYYGLTDPGSLVGQQFLETDLGRFVQGWPETLTQGPQYVIYYSRSCEHCQDFLETYLLGPPPVPVTLVAIPEKKSGFDESGWLDMAFCKECAPELELPTGVDYLVTPPVLFALMEGEVQCVKEAEDTAAPECLLFGM